MMGRTSKKRKKMYTMAGWKISGQACVMRSYRSWSFGDSRSLICLLEFIYTTSGFVFSHPRFYDEISPCEPISHLHLICSSFTYYMWD